MNRREFADEHECRIGSCGKLSFEHRSEARRSRKRLIKSGTTDRAEAWRLGIYWCDRCEAYHVGHDWLKQRWIRQAPITAPELWAIRAATA